jgi:DUF2075 family protein
MKLYTGSVHDFIKDTMENTLPDKLVKAYVEYFSRQPNNSEVMSWVNSSQFLKNVLQIANLKDNMMILEYGLPYSSQRIDCMLFGKGTDGSNNTVVIELKQWSRVEPCDVENNVLVYVGGAERMEPHPSYQVAGYHYYLKDFVSVFNDEPKLELWSCCYCHNYSKATNVLFSANFASIQREFPVFAKEDFGLLAEYLKQRLAGGRGLELFNRFIQSPVRPSKKLIEHAREMLARQRVFNLLETQITAFNTIMDRASKCAKSEKKTTIIVRGGPGTGKSVMALNILAELLSKGYTVYHATGSAAFTSTLRKIAGLRAAKLFKYFNSFTMTKDNEIDVLICDEAHRIRETSNSRYTKHNLRSAIPQVEELIRAARLTVFFIDDLQVVRPQEIGSTELIKRTASKFGCEIFEFELTTQFRCSGSDGYLDWIDDILQIRSTGKKYLTKEDGMEFKIFDDPKKLYEEIMKKNKQKPNSARMVAGFCWPWSDPLPDGTLKEDVVIGDFRMTWEAKNEARKLAPGIPRAALWAYDPNGVNQMGSIYTVQGFEFEYVGVIFGNDLVYEPSFDSWIAKPENSADHVVKRDKKQFLKHAKNAYRVLLTRGMKGCYVYFLDDRTRQLFESRLKS